MKNNPQRYFIFEAEKKVIKIFLNLAITFLILNTLCSASDQRGINIVSSSHSKSSSLGCYYAYIIGINAYGEGWTNQNANSHRDDATHGG